MTPREYAEVRDWFVAQVANARRETAADPDGPPPPNPFRPGAGTPPAGEADDDGLDVPTLDEAMAANSAFDPDRASPRRAFDPSRN